MEIIRLCFDANLAINNIKFLDYLDFSVFFPFELFTIAFIWFKWFFEKKLNCIFLLHVTSENQKGNGGKKKKTFFKNICFKTHSNHLLNYFNSE